jgi:hypothetical protein
MDVLLFSELPATQQKTRGHPGKAAAPGGIFAWILSKMRIK